MVHGCRNSFAILLASHNDFHEAKSKPPYFCPIVQVDSKFIISNYRLGYIVAELSEEFFLQQEASRKYDFRLVMLLRVALGKNDELDGNSFPLSVLVSGMHIRGQVITHGVWENEQIESFRSADDEGSRNLGTILAGMQEAFNDHNAEVAAEASESFTPPRWIHFRDAVVGTGTDAVHHKHFRVALDEITGWAFGA